MKPTLKHFAVIGIVATAITASVIATTRNGNSLQSLAEPVAVAATNINKDARTNVALEGYDPVAFFTVGEATKGSPGVQAEHNGAVYFFADEANKATFLADPESFLPAYGGYCAFGASKNLLLPVDIQTWEIIDGKLILQYSDGAKETFSQDVEGYLEKADEYWNSIN